MDTYYPAVIIFNTYICNNTVSPVNEHYWEMKVNGMKCNIARSFEVRETELKSQPHYSRALWPRASYLIFASVSSSLKFLK